MLLDWNETEVLLVLLETFKEQTEQKIQNVETQINSDITKDWKENEARI